MKTTQTVSTKEDKKAIGLRKAKSILIEDIAKIRGYALSTNEFNELYDLDIDQLLAAIIVAQDERYFDNRRLKASKLY